MRGEAQEASSNIMGAGAVDRGHDWEYTSQYRFNPTVGNCSDLKEEKSALQQLVGSRGHILVMTPKYHPELAGVGIEYAWGTIKLEFRRLINDEDPKNLRDNTLKTLNTGHNPHPRPRA